MTSDFRPGVQRSRDNIPPPPPNGDGTLGSVLKIIAIFLVLRIAMIEMDSKIINIPLIDDGIFWSLDTIRFKLWQWGFIGSEHL